MTRLFLNYNLCSVVLTGKKSWSVEEISAAYLSMSDSIFKQRTEIFVDMLILYILKKLKEKQTLIFVKRVRVNLSI
jgi:hypothetical protein